MLSFNLKSTEYASFYAPYINELGNVDLNTELEESLTKFIVFLNSIPKDKLEYRYEEGKWTIKDILLHLIDAERIFAYRALRISRKDKTPLPGFDENSYAEAAKANKIEWNNLIEEFKLVRLTTIILFNRLEEEEIERVGVASGYEVSVRALGFIILGHQKHHKKIIKERYL